MAQIVFLIFASVLSVIFVRKSWRKEGKGWSDLTTGWANKVLACLIVPLVIGSLVINVVTPRQWGIFALVSVTAFLLCAVYFMLSSAVDDFQKGEIGLGIGGFVIGLIFTGAAIVSGMGAAYVSTNAKPFRDTTSLYNDEWTCTKSRPGPKNTVDCTQYTAR